MKNTLKLFIGAVLSLVTVCAARDWKEKVADASMEKVVKLTMYGTMEVEFFGMSLGKHPFVGSCSGVYIDEEGAILTAGHCLDSNEKVTISSVTATNIDGYTIEVTNSRMFTNQIVDLAYISAPKVNRTFSFAKLSSVSRLRVAQDVLAIGHPLGLDWTVTTGIVNSPLRMLYLWGFYTQFDAVIAPGSSGGPVFDRKGDLIGIMSRYRGGPAGSLTGLNFMVDLNVIKGFLKDIEKQLSPSDTRTRRYRLGDLK